MSIKYLTKDTIKQIQDRNFLIKGYDPKDGSIILEQSKNFVPKGVPQTVWNRSSHKAGIHGTTLLNDFLGDKNRFNYPKSLYAVTDTLATIVLDKPEALILDFFAGSGTTLHATSLLNKRDDGSRRCILITNNEVADKTANLLDSEGIHKGDKEFEAKGIFQSVTVPRCEAAVTGKLSDGRLLDGQYLEKYIKNYYYRDGFEENIQFLTLEYLDSELIELGRLFKKISPLLWMQAGAIGTPEYWDGKSPWIISNNSYGVLFDERHINDFAKAVGASDVTHTWLVNNSYSAFMEAKRVLPQYIEVYQLYENYLKYFTKGK